MINIGKSTNKFRNALIAFIVMLAVCEILRIILREVSYPAGTPPEASDFTWSILSQVIAMYGLPLLLVFLAERPKPRTLIHELGYRSTIKWWVYLVAVLLGFLALFVTMGINVFTSLFITLTGGRIPTYSSNLTNNAGYFLLAILGTAVLPALCEEGLHRGILLRGLRTRFKDVTLIVLTALFFSLMHTYIIQTPYTFVFGLILGTLAVKLDCMWPAVIIHFVNNAAATYSDYATQFNWVGGDAMNAGYDFLNNLIANNLGLAAFLWFCIVGVVLALVYVCIKYGRRKKTTVETTPKFDILTGENLLSNRTLSCASVADKVWLSAAIFCGAIFTFFSYLSLLL